MDAYEFVKQARFEDRTLPVDVNMATIQVWSDPFMTPSDKLRMTGMFNNAQKFSSGAPITGADIAGSLLETGFNMAAAAFAGKIVGSMFGISREAQNTLSATGVMYTGLKGLGVI